MHYSDMRWFHDPLPILSLLSAWLLGCLACNPLEAEDRFPAQAMPSASLNWYTDLPPESGSLLYVTVPTDEQSQNLPYAITLTSPTLKEAATQNGVLQADKHQVAVFDLPMPSLALTTDDRLRPEVQIQIGDSVQNHIPTPSFYHQIKAARGSILADADLADWGPLRHMVQRPFFGFGQEFWTGLDDGWFAFDAALDNDLLLIAIQVHDDEVHGNAGLAPWEQDGFELRLDLRDQPRPNGELIQRETGITLIAASPGEEGLGSHVWNAQSLPKGTEIHTQIHANGWNAEIKIPLRSMPEFHRQQGIIRAIRINIAINDHDFHKQKPDEKGKQLWWRPDWRKPHYIKSGIFLLPSSPLG